MIQRLLKYQLFVHCRGFSSLNTCTLSIAGVHHIDVSWYVMLIAPELSLPFSIV